MAVRRFAALSGLVLLLLGIIGFINPHAFGWFHLDTTHNVIHVVVGLLGLLAASGEGYAFRFSQMTGLLFMLMAVLGFFTKDLFGLMHVGLTDNVLHFIVGAIALYFGYVLTGEEQPTRSARVN